jgi:hypothetical protein
VQDLRQVEHRKRHSGHEVERLIHRYRLNHLG